MLTIAKQPHYKHRPPTNWHDLFQLNSIPIVWLLSLIVVLVTLVLGVCSRVD